MGRLQCPDQAVAVGAGEAGIDEERLFLTSDQGGGLVLRADGEVQVDDCEVEGAHAQFLLCERRAGFAEDVQDATVRASRRRSIWSTLA